jgi:hypothetical protein
MASLIKLVGILAVVTIAIVYGKHAWREYRTKAKRRQRLLEIGEGNIFCTGVELPYGSEQSKKLFSTLLMRLHGKLLQKPDDVFQVMYHGVPPRADRPGDQPMIRTYFLCLGNHTRLIQQEIRNVYRDATLIPQSPMPKEFMEAIEAYRAEHFPDPEEKPSHDGGNQGQNRVLGDGEIEMTSGGGLVGKLQARKGSRA